MVLVVPMSLVLCVLFGQVWAIHSDLANHFVLRILSSRELAVRVHWHGNHTYLLLRQLLCMEVDNLFFVLISMVLVLPMSLFLCVLLRQVKAMDSDLVNWEFRMTAHKTSHALQRFAIESHASLFLALLCHRVAQTPSTVLLSLAAAVCL